MTTFTKFSSQLQYNIVFLNPVLQNLQIPFKSQIMLSTSLVKPLLSQALVSKKPGGFSSNALKTKKKRVFSLSETEGLDDGFVDGKDDGELDGADIEFEGDDDEMMFPPQNMEKWLENRPRGFGEGKVYDTSIEDQLMEEIEQSRKAQLDNINKLRSTSRNTNSDKDLTKKEKVSVDMPNGFRVRLINLPKKKNIHKDLRIAFNGISGILNVVPVVSGNEKTRDPVCKGLAFIDFKYQDEAERFVGEFSGKIINFGKVEKKIKCEMQISMLPSPLSAPDRSVNGPDHTPQQAVLMTKDGSDIGIDIDNSSLNSWGESESMPSRYGDVDENYEFAQWEVLEEVMDASKASSKDLKLKQGSASKASSLKLDRKAKQNNKKAASNNQKNEIPKFTVPGSARRLKIREKAMLNGVFSKYGSKAIPTVKEQ